MNVELRCVDRDCKGEIWTLRLGEKRVVVKDEEGAIVADFPPGQVVRRFQIPSFSNGVKYFGITCDDESVYRFQVASSDMRFIKDYLDQSIVATGPEAILAIRTTAIRDTAIGFACTVGGIAVTAGTYLVAANNPEGGRYFIAHGIVLAGLVFLGRGVYGFILYGKIQRAADEEFEDEDE